MQNFNITKNFTYNELTKTRQKKHLLDINREKGIEHLDKMRLLCYYFLEPIRTRYGLPVIITSCFRCLLLNNAIGGSLSSQHLKAEVADFYVKGYPLNKVFDYISTNLIFGQLIYYIDKNFIHGSLPTLKNNGQILIFENGKYRKIA